MAALKFSVLTIFFLCSCAHSQHQKSVKVESLVDGCFTFNNITLDVSKEPVLATASINLKPANADCPCKSALMKYTAFQKNDGNIFELLSSQFSTLDKESVVLPIAVQKQLIIQDTAIYLSLSCASKY